jgi:hypothetical protein
MFTIEEASSKSFSTQHYYMSIHKNLGKILLAPATLFLGLALLSSGFYTPVANAANNSDLNNAEIETVKDLFKENNLENRKLMIKDKASKTKNKKLKEILETQIPASETLVKTIETNYKNKFDSDVKNYACNLITFTKNTYAVYGNLLFDFTTKTNGCYEGNSYFTSAGHFTSYGNTRFAGWQYYGVQTDRQWDYFRSSTSFTSSRQGLFKLNLPGGYTYLEVRPYIQAELTLPIGNSYAYMGS